MSAPASRLDSLTGLRIILAVMVLVSHAWVRTGLITADSIWSRAPEEFGHCGVVGFFVLSGYILAHVYRDRQWSLREFVTNRVARIYPLYFVGMLFALPLDWFSPGMAHEGRAEALGLTVILQQSWFPFALGRFNSPGWTLSVEALFYLLFPILFFLWKRRPPLFVSVSVAAAVATAIVWNPDSFFRSHLFPPMRVWEFLFGMVLAMVPIRKFMAIPEVVPLSFVFVSPVIATILHSSGPPFAKWVSMALLAGVSILILAARDTEPGTRSLLRLKWMVIGGEISYGLYLLHDGIQRYGRVAFEKLSNLPLREAAVPMKISYLLSTTFASLVLAWICWKLVEIPARSWLRKKLAPNGNT